MSALQHHLKTSDYSANICSLNTPDGAYDTAADAWAGCSHALCFLGK